MVPLGLDMKQFDIVGLAKRHEEVFFPHRSDPVLLSRRSEALFLLQRVRNEAHRFAVTFHRKRRAKRSLKSELDDLKGVGQARRKLLLNHFGTMSKIRQASLEDLEKVVGLPKNVAASIYNTLHPPVPLVAEEGGEYDVNEQ